MIFFFHLIGFCDLKTIIHTFVFLDKRFKTICCSDVVWKQLIKNDFKENKKNKDMNYKTFYQYILRKREFLTCLKQIPEDENYESFSFEEKHLETLDGLNKIIDKFLDNCRPYSFNYIKPRTYIMCLAIVKRYGTFLKYIEHQTDEMCLAAIEKDGEVLKYIKNQTNEIRQPSNE